MKITKKLLKVPYYFFITGVVVIGLFLLATIVPLSNFKVKIVKSGSMEPTIKTGGIVVLRPAQNYKLGDIITFGKDTKTQVPTTHRIIEISADGQSIQTKGDANDAPDPVPISLSDVHGKVIFSMSYAGYVLDFARKPLGFALLIGLPALIIICDELGKIWREIKKIRRKIPTNKTPNILDLRIRPKIDPKSSFSFRNTALIFLLILPMIALGRIGSTVSYYNENEASLGNTMKAGTNFPSAIVLSPQPATLPEVLTEKIITAQTMSDEATTTDQGTTTDQIIIPEEKKKAEAPPEDKEVAPEAPIAPTPQVAETPVSAAE